MARDIINAPDLHAVVTASVQAAPMVLRGKNQQLERTLRWIAENHTSVRPARRRRDDPDWAQAKFDRLEALYRFCEDGAHDLKDELTDVLREIGQISTLAAGNDNTAKQAQRFLRSLPHRRMDSFDIGRIVREFLELHETERLMSRRHAILRDDAERKEMEFVGRLCRTVDEIIQLGRETSNCLKDGEQYWRAFVEGRADFWVLRRGSRIVAVIECRRANNWVKQALAPGNNDIAVEDLRGVTAFCAAAGLNVDRNSEGLLPDFAAAPLIGPKAVETKRGVATYVEWESAVRIDFAEREVVFRRGRLTERRTLVLSIPTELAALTAIAQGYDLYRPIAQFGKKNLRRIVSKVARGNITPTVVQHRLLALTA